MTRTRTGWWVMLVVALVTATSATAAQGAPPTVTATQLKSGFKKATGQKLVVDEARSSAGHYTAFNLGVQTKTKQSRYGTFTLYLVTGSDVAADVHRLLVDPHTGELGTPVGGNYWERAVTMTGQQTWTAKRLYGANVVLWWTTASAERKTDRTYVTLHKALKGIVAGR